MIVLSEPIVVKNLTRLKVQSVQYEANQERGQEWVEVYCDYGFMDEGTFYAYPVPGILSSLKYFKFENGMHPERPGMMLGRCSECNKWFFATSGDCDEPGCTGVVEPFPCYNRFRNKIDASAERDVFTATEAFLTNEPTTEGIAFPNPDDITDVRPLVDGTP
jgi:hypothetical protein